jgi:diguanylate cyclase (GGDEF)-like protein
MTPEIDERRDAARDDTIETLGLHEPSAYEGFQEVTNLLLAALDVDLTAFTVMYEDMQIVRAGAGAALPDRPRDDSFCQVALNAGDDILLVEDATRDARFADLPLVTGQAGIHAYAGAAVHAPNGLVVGYLCALHGQPRAFSAADIGALQDARKLLEAALLLREAALLDPLTGVFNRRYFDDRFDREIRRAYRHLAPITLFLIDIDDFRAYNDLMGQKQGDVVLKQIAMALQGTIRRGGDLIARFSGGQFVVVLPDTNAGYAELLAERLRNAVAELELEHPGASSRRLTISCGGAVAQQTRDLAAGSSLVLAVAEQALYQARRDGEDGSVVHTISEAFGRGDSAVI